MDTWINYLKHYWNNNYIDADMEQFITGIVWFYSTLSTILWLWIIYLFTIREWLDWRRIKIGKPDYDFNGMPRTSEIKNNIRKNK